MLEALINLFLIENRIGFISVSRDATQIYKATSYLRLSRGHGEFSARFRRARSREDRSGSRQCLSKSSGVGFVGCNRVLTSSRRHGIFRPLVPRLYYTLKLRVMRWSRDLGLDLAIFTLQPTVRVGGFERGENAFFLSSPPSQPGERIYLPLLESPKILNLFV